MERLLADADEVAADAVVDDALLGDVGQLAVHLEDADAGRDDHRQLAGAVEAAVQVVLLEDVQRHVQHFQEVALRRRRVHALDSLDTRPDRAVIFDSTPYLFSLNVVNHVEGAASVPWAGRVAGGAACGGPERTTASCGRGA